jgi:hypothetical protein
VKAFVDEWLHITMEESSFRTLMAAWLEEETLNLIASRRHRSSRGRIKVPQFHLSYLGVRRLHLKRPAHIRP